MDEAGIILALLGLLAILFGLPIWALARTTKISRLERRIEGLEAALLRVMREREATARSAEPQAEREREGVEQSVPAPPPPAEAPAPRPPAPEPAVAKALDTKRLEELIGERWLGWAGISVLLFGAAFFLKYAFDNRWIGELGRVGIGLVAGLTFVWLGWKRHQVGWRTFSQIFTAGGVTLLYLAVYASYGFYDLIPAAAAFGFLVLIVLQAHLLAVLYNAPAIAVMGQIGGFLTPILLSTGRDNYAVLFSWILLLDLGVVVVCLRRNWGWIASFSFALSHAMFWGWHAEHYHPEKLWPAVGFQAGVFVLFLTADLLPLRRGAALGPETWIRLFLNPAVFFATAYSLLERDYEFWMGSFAVLMALLYATVGKAALRWNASDRRPTLIAVGIALLFVTLAVPIQLESNWITLGWGVQAVVLAWLATKLRGDRLRYACYAVAALAIGRQLAFDTPWDYRAAFTPVFNRDFLSAWALAACFFGAAWLLRAVKRRESWALGLGGVFLIWLSSTVEVYSHFHELSRAPNVDYAVRRALDWTAQMWVSVLWSVFAAVLVAGGLKWKVAPLRWTGFGLFGVTVLKAFFVDITLLEGVYRIAALVALGLLLLGVGWAYQKMRAAPDSEAEEPA